MCQWSEGCDISPCAVVLWCCCPSSVWQIWLKANYVCRLGRSAGWRATGQTRKWWGPLCTPQWETWRGHTGLWYSASAPNYRLISLTSLDTLIWIVTFHSTKVPQRLWPFGAHKALATTSHITPQTTNKQSFHVHHLALPVININIMASSASLLSYFMQNLFLNHVNIEERTIC